MTLKRLKTFLRKIYHEIIEIVFWVPLKIFGLDGVESAALDILSIIVHLEKRNITKRPIPLDKQVFFIFANRMIIDAQSALLLAKKGYYGTGYSILAVMLRSITMYASLVADKSRLNRFWNEDADTYNVDREFYKSFRESAIRDLAKSKFGKDAFDRSEFEKLLHGSCYAIRKYYSKRHTNSDGKTEPLLLFGKFKQERKRAMVRSITGAIVLDFLGIFFTGYTENKRNDFDTLLSYYYKVIKRAQIENSILEKKFMQ